MSEPKWWLKVTTHPQYLDELAGVLEGRLAVKARYVTEVHGQPFNIWGPFMLEDAAKLAGQVELKSLPYPEWGSNTYILTNVEVTTLVEEQQYYIKAAQAEEFKRVMGIEEGFVAVSNPQASHVDFVSSYYYKVNGEDAGRYAETYGFDASLLDEDDLFSYYYHKFS